MAARKVWIIISAVSFPKVTKHPQHGHLFIESGPLLIKFNNGKKDVAVPGSCRQFLQDNNAPHINAKKGDYYFADSHGQYIDKPIAYFPLEDLVAVLEPDKAEASQKNVVSDQNK
jgi:hypothetical protein